MKLGCVRLLKEIYSSYSLGFCPLSWDVDDPRNLLLPAWLPCEVVHSRSSGTGVHGRRFQKQISQSGPTFQGHLSDRLISCLGLPFY